MNISALNLYNYSRREKERRADLSFTTLVHGQQFKSNIACENLLNSFLGKMRLKSNNIFRSELVNLCFASYFDLTLDETHVNRNGNFYKNVNSYSDEISSP